MWTTSVGEVTFGRKLRRSSSRVWRKMSSAPSRPHAAQSSFIASEAPGGGASDASSAPNAACHAASLIPYGHSGPAARRGTYVGTIASNGTSTIDYIFGSIGASGVAAGPATESVAGPRRPRTNRTNPRRVRSLNCHLCALVLTLGSSAGFTYVSAKGPTACTWTTVRPLAIA